MGLAGIELRYLVDTISEQVAGYYVSNIYGITRDSILFKLHHPEKPDIFLMLTTFGMWITDVKIDQVEQHRLTRRLRSDLLRLRISGICQVGTDRITRIAFSGPDREFVVVAEFFGEGNILLCSTAMKILALQRSLEVRHRTLRVGTTYEPPPQNGPDIFNLSQGDISPIHDSKLACGRWVGRSLGLPSRYVEEILARANVDPSLPGTEMTVDQQAAILDAARDIVDSVSGGRHDPVIIRGEEPEACPIRIGGDAPLEPVPSFGRALDIIFTERVLRDARSTKTADEGRRVEQLKNQLEEQDAAIQLVGRRSEAISGAARLLLEMVAQGHLSLDDHVGERLAETGVQILVEKGRPLLGILDRKIAIDPRSSIHATASILFDEAKKQSAAVPAIERQRRKTERDLEVARSRASGAEQSVAYSEIRKKSWFERYRWFITSDGNLAIGGRDASSNSSIIRKHLEGGDKVFHAEIFGSPFFILKDCQKVRPASVNETAHATVCFSRAWREAIYGLSAYWVNPEQVKKAAPSGQFLPHGSFSIEGQRNFVRAPALKLCVGILERDGDYLLECGPPGAVRTHSLWHAVIEPGGSEAPDTAKRIRSEFMGIDEEISARFTVDDYLRAIPAGKSHVVSVKRRE